MGTLDVTVFGERLLTKFAQKHAPSRRPLARFLEIARAAEWKHMPDLKEAFPATDFDAAAQRYIFDIGGNKYRLAASVNFEKQAVLIEAS